MRILDAYMPEYDRRVRHATDVRADVETVASSICRTNLGQSALVRALLARSCGPALLAAHRQRPVRRLTLDALQALGCVLLRSEPEHEVALGAIGTAGATRCILRPVEAEAFRSACEPNAAKVLWHFSVLPAGELRSTLTLETRVRCFHGGDRERILLRWDIFERLGARARHDVLLAMKTAAESGRFSSASSDMGLNGDLGGRSIGPPGQP